MSKLIFREIHPTEFSLYDQLVVKDGSIFGRREWLRVLIGQTHFLGLFDGGDNLLGACPIQVSKLFGLNVIKRAAFTPFLGPFYAEQLKDSRKFNETNRFFMTELCNWLLQASPAICCMPLAIGVSDCLPFRWANFKVGVGYTYQIPLNDTPKEQFANYTSTRRRNIRAAQKAGVQIQPLTDYQIVETLAEKTFARQGKSIPLSVMKGILFDFATDQNSFATVALKDDAPVSCVFCVHDSGTAYYLIGGYDEERGHHGAGAACMHEAILMAHSQGLKTFDFEGSSIPAIERYFRGFGGELITYPTINRAWLPLELALKFKKRDIF